MIKMLDRLVEQYKNNNCLYLSWDGASWHASKKFLKKVDEYNNQEYRKQYDSPMIRLAPLPANAQFLNVIESIFSGMARAIIHNSDYQSVDECKNAIDRYFDERNMYFQKEPKRAGNKIWKKERMDTIFRESNNCKDPYYR